jgi:hypothetical protein
VHTRSRAARQRLMQGGALHHRAFCVNFWIESLPWSVLFGGTMGGIRADLGRTLERSPGPDHLSSHLP